MLLRGFHLSRHLIFISFQRRTWLSDRIDHPQFLYCPVVGYRYRKVSGIGRPTSRYPPAFTVAKRIGIQHTVRNAITEILHSILCQLNLENRTVLLVFPGFLIIFPTHPEKVTILSIYHRLAIGRKISPSQFFRFLFLSFQMSKFTGRIIIREIKDFFFSFLLVFLLFFRFHFLRRFHLKSKRPAVFLCLEITYRQMAGLERITNDLRQLSSQFIPVEQQILCTRNRIDHIPKSSFTRFILEPETISFLKPMRIDQSRKQHVLQLISGKLFCLQIFRQPLLRKYLTGTTKADK